MGQHGLEQGLRHVVESAQGDVEHGVPVFGGHECEQVVAADACVVHQHFYVAFGVGVFPCFQHFRCLLAVAYVEGQHFSAASCGLHLLQCLAGFGVAADAVDEDVVAHAGQSDADGSSYASAASGH